MKTFRQRQLPFGNGGIRSIIFLYFTITAAAASIFIGLSLYTRMSGQVSETVMEENQILIDQVNRSVENYLKTVMKLSDSLYYSIIKNADLSDPSVGERFNLLYENNMDQTDSIALFSADGTAGIGTGSSCAKQSGCNKGGMVFLYAGSDGESAFFSSAGSADF